jgi:hypothetical protein
MLGRWGNQEIIFLEIEKQETRRVKEKKVAMNSLFLFQIIG